MGFLQLWGIESSFLKRLVLQLPVLLFAWTQFEDGILDACLMLLDVNPKFLKNRGRDCSRRNSPIYVGRVVSGMVSMGEDTGEPWQTTPFWDDEATVPVFGDDEDLGQERASAKEV